MEEKTPRKWSTGGKMMIAAALLILAAIGQYVYISWTGLGGGEAMELRMIDTQKGVVYDFDVNTSFYSYDSRNFFFCTKDGMKYITSNGDNKWPPVIFNLSKPVMVAKGGTVAVGEAKGRNFYVFNTEGLLYEISLDEPVLFFSVNQAGYLSVIQQADNGYAIRVYSKDKTDKPLYTNQFHDTGIIPTSVDISEDGSCAAIALLDVNIRLTSKVAFYHINSTDAGAMSEGMFASEDQAGQMIACVRFMANNRVVVLTDKQIACYRTENKSLFEEWTVPLHNKVDLLTFYGEQRFAYVTGDKLLNDEEAEDPGVVRIYNINGDNTGSFSLGRKATYLSMGYDAVIVGADRSFYALNSRGGRLWEYIALQDTQQVIFLDNTDTVLMAAGTRASVWKRTRQRAEVPEPDWETPLEVEVDE